MLSVFSNEHLQSYSVAFPCNGEVRAELSEPEKLKHAPLFFISNQHHGTEAVVTFDGELSTPVASTLVT